METVDGVVPDLDTSMDEARLPIGPQVGIEPVPGFQLDSPVTGEDIRTQFDHRLGQTTPVIFQWLSG